MNKKIGYVKLTIREATEDAIQVHNEMEFEGSTYDAIHLCACLDILKDRILEDTCEGVLPLGLAEAMVEAIKEDIQE